VTKPVSGNVWRRLFLVTAGQMCQGWAAKGVFQARLATSNCGEMCVCVCVCVCVCACVCVCVCVCVCTYAATMTGVIPSAEAAFTYVDPVVSQMNDSALECVGLLTAQWIGRRPSASPTSSRAPAVTRRRIMARSPRSAASCRAVCPSWATAFTLTLLDSRSSAHPCVLPGGGGGGGGSGVGRRRRRRRRRR
jgi:hypothetical protein